MIFPFEDPEEPEEPLPTPPKDDHIKNAVVIAALSALAAGLVSWGLDELRSRFGSRAPKPCVKCEEKKAPEPTREDEDGK